MVNRGVQALGTICLPRDCYLQRRSHRDDRVSSRMAIANISASVFRVVSPGHPLDILHRGPTPGGIYSGSFVPREPPRHSRQGGHLFFCPFFLSFFPFLHSLVFPRSQVLTKNLVQWTDLNDARRVWIGSVHPRNSNASRRKE